MTYIRVSSSDIRLVKKSKCPISPAIVACQTIYWFDRWNSCAEIIFLLVNSRIGTIQTIPATTWLQRSIMFKIELWSHKEH